MIGSRACWRDGRDKGRCPVCVIGRSRAGRRGGRGEGRGEGVGMTGKGSSERGGWKRAEPVDVILCKLITR